ncbi:HAMP domain-containing histidine kinase [Robertmurraya korlensis]|uniref:sensor histidine kinase n=1 Tax=Robertmurraya korlensis TaxID=519977 RepID=UPI00203F3806|nr:HAMP domain-containing sensor histidine kinase [Robertmurraya korlensis]MCM3602967.1 HAMP domain-containing histidine kinase [Robertmurraya korlensis]
MLRNREFQLFVLLQLLIGGTAVVVASLSLIEPVFLIVLTTLLFIASSLVFTCWRYIEIKKLSGYLRKISSGGTSLDIRDNYEGELSILKTEIYKVTIMLSEHKKLLQRDKVHLTDAISDISHQLKTPLTSMMVMADLLSASTLSEGKRKEFTKNIQVQLERIEWLVSSLLKLSKLDAGTVTFKKDPVNVKQLIEKSVEPLLIPMDIKDQKLIIDGVEDVSFLGDFHWTREALINVLKNAVEHTKEGGEIRIQYTENPLFTEISIVDNGEGIAKADLPYVFQRFYKGKNASEESVGIGLAMAHSMITRQNGTLEVKSKEGVGTTFLFKIFK